GRLFFRDTHLHEMLRSGRCRLDLEIETVMMIDSLEMVDAHRQQVLAACRAAPESALVVVHGTDTMVETARTLGQAQLAKTIVLTGAMVPYAIADSDASFNLGAAIGFARSLAPGVWVSMNGLAHTWSNVRKNRERGVFESLG
ncbi:MAG: asparaginase, partial [Burkholderiales bacterium]